MTIEQTSLLIGLFAGIALFVMLLWSIAFPKKRLWPPKKSTLLNQMVVWGLTITIFGSAFVLGIADWNSLKWPTAFRWGAGMLLIIAGNLVVWKAVFNIGLKATSGEAAQLQTDGLYQYSRNPQYVADMGILLGWAILSASLSVFFIVCAGIAILAIAPLAEESWLKNTYGKVYQDYYNSVRRYF